MGETKNYGKGTDKDNILIVYWFQMIDFQSLYLFQDPWTLMVVVVGKVDMAAFCQEVFGTHNNRDMEYFVGNF